MHLCIGADVKSFSAHIHAIFLRSSQSGDTWQTIEHPIATGSGKPLLVCERCTESISGIIWAWTSCNVTNILQMITRSKLSLSVCILHHSTQKREKLAFPLAFHHENTSEAHITRTPTQSCLSLCSFINVVFF
ncbi:hypothetical protein QQF64_001744 [Cirrhinus molitorella]|uniref:Uncharacterized protein n=1 Tax=Cirrhinus molitorella TaxID=172907 RepID=A0ABR3P167_9TELE